MSARTFGNVSDWTRERCTSIPLDDRSLTPSGAWTRGSGAAYFQGTFSRSSTSGAALTRTGAQVLQLALLATKCPTCGKADVYLNNTLLATVDLRSATTQHRQIVMVKSYDALQAGTIRVQVRGSGRPVTIDGVGISRR